MRKIVFAICFVLSSTALAVTGNGTGSSVQVTGGGTGSSVQVTGGGTGSSVQVTGGGTGSSVQVTGNGTGSSVQVTGNGTGSSVQVTGNGTGSSTEVTGGGTGSPQAVSIDACMSGSFYDPENPGWGINVEVLESTIIAYMYWPDGSWFLFQGDDNGMDAYQPYGDGVDKVGEGFFIPLDDNTVEFGYDIKLNLFKISRTRPIPWCIGCANEFVLSRLTQPIPCAEEAETEVTGNGTGKPEVTGGGTGSPQVTGGGTGSSVKVTGNGTGSQVQVTGGGTGRE